MHLRGGPVFARSLVFSLEEPHFALDAAGGLGQEPMWGRFTGEICYFLAEEGAAGLSPSTKT